jgi:hypothetical protein
MAPWGRGSRHGFLFWIVGDCGVGWGGVEWGLGFFAVRVDTPLADVLEG